MCLPLPNKLYLYCQFEPEPECCGVFFNYIFYKPQSTEPVIKEKLYIYMNLYHKAVIQMETLHG